MCGSARGRHVRRRLFERGEGVNQQLDTLYFRQAAQVVRVKRSVSRTTCAS